MPINYRHAFITVSPDTAATCGTAPARAGSVAQLQHALLSERPYGLTSEELLFEVHARRGGVAEADRAAAWAAFFARPQACLRASPLVKSFGWGLHHDGEGRVALYGVESADYAALSRRADLKVVAGMRSRRG
jgi:hypothetical protein